MTAEPEFFEAVLKAFPPLPCNLCGTPITPRTAQAHVRDEHPGVYAEMAARVTQAARILLGEDECPECGGTGWSNSHPDAFPCEACDGSGSKRRPQCT